LRAPSSFYRSLTEKAEIFFVFGFDGSGHSVLIKKLEFKLLSERISKNVEPDSGDSDSNDDNVQSSFVHVTFCWRCRPR
jgi:hypothetical protein